MTMTDPIADLFTRIRNAGNAGRTKVDIPYSKLKENIVATLVGAGYLREQQVTEIEGRKRIRTYLRLDEDNRPIIERIERVSKPGCRQYRRADDVERVLRGMGIGIYSTSGGVFTDEQCREKGVGGEYLGRVW